jgi:glucokinase
MARILTADIGGTNSRFGSFDLTDSGELTLQAVRWLPTEPTGSLAGQLTLLGEGDFPLLPARADIAVFAVAGPVEAGRRSKLPLAGWEIDLDQLEREFPLTRTLLINDFFAQALAVGGPPGRDARLILAGNPDPAAPLAVIGAGTGLGKALLVADGRGDHLVVPSEGGHADFPFGGGREQQYQNFLLEKCGGSYLSGNTVVSGQGLSYLHEFLAGAELSPAQVVREFPAHPETHAWEARFYGRVARNYVLETLALGGLYIAGGVAAKAPELLEHPAFREEFHHSPTMGHLLRRVPVRLISDENSGLWGAAIQARRLLTS